MFMLMPAPFWPMNYLQEESGFTFSVFSNNIVTDCNFSSPQPFLSEAKSILFCQPVLLSHVLQPLHQSGGLHWSHTSVTVFLPCPGDPQTRHSTSDIVLQMENREKRTLLLAMLFTMQPTMCPKRTCNVLNFVKCLIVWFWDLKTSMYLLKKRIQRYSKMFQSL